ncbi:hypothetical protein HD553DRAFT_334652 [Filobasidium floriforme]|uniref:uncharacterized protein n=1 Tax=Filobasidium floriforme TaxID=5210 RepID=UPI001E8DEA36|nr:uncharacterized protein HD553DRAFT_334652 [Filobasidium floriforme]KAH8086936.1 hypothetical protein HD553DRAFT_334652 [Filobasidium floriforme]
MAGKRLGDSQDRANDLLCMGTRIVTCVANKDREAKMLDDWGFAVLFRRLSMIARTASYRGFLGIVPVGMSSPSCGLFRISQTPTLCTQLMHPASCCAGPACVHSISRFRSKSENDRKALSLRGTWKSQPPEPSKRGQQQLEQSVERVARVTAEIATSSRERGCYRSTTIHTSHTAASTLLLLPLLVSLALFASFSLLSLLSLRRPCPNPGTATRERTQGVPTSRTLLPAVQEKHHPHRPRPTWVTSWTVSVHPPHRPPRPRSIRPSYQPHTSYLLAYHTAHTSHLGLLSRRLSLALPVSALVLVVERNERNTKTTSEEDEQGQKGEKEVAVHRFNILVATYPASLHSL